MSKYKVGQLLVGSERRYGYYFGEKTEIAKIVKMIRRVEKKKLHDVWPTNSCLIKHVKEIRSLFHIDLKRSKDLINELFVKLDWADTLAKRTLPPKDFECFFYLIHTPNSKETNYELVWYPEYILELIETEELLKHWRVY